MIDVTGIMRESNIVLASYEQYCDMSDATCYLNRAITTTNTFLGIGYLCSSLIDISDKVFKINRTKKERGKLNELVLWLHDSVYTGMFTATFNTIVYSVTNSLSESPKNIKEIALMDWGQEEFLF